MLPLLPPLKSGADFVTFFDTLKVVEMMNYKSYEF